MCMNQTIQLPKLLKRLREADDESGCFESPLYAVDGFCDGVLYLYDNVLKPLMEGAEVNTGDLDMERFAQEDIGTIFDFYNDNYTGYSREFSRLRHWYNTCCKAPARCTQTAFL